MPLTIISDLHISAGRKLFDSHGELAALIREDCCSGDEPHLVLAGDTFDFLPFLSERDTYDLDRAPEHMATILEDDANLPIVDALREFLRRGTVSILPGNHDPEVELPGVWAVLADRLGGGENLKCVRGGAPLSLKVANTDIIVEHGHLYDRLNRIDHASLRGAGSTASAVPLPPGSRIVTRLMSRFIDRHSWIDQLKPELPLVPLALLYFEGSTSEVWDAIRDAIGIGLNEVRAALRRIVDGKTFGLGAAADPADELAAALCPRGADDVVVAEEILATREPAMHPFRDEHQREPTLAGGSPWARILHASMQGQRAYSDIARSDELFDAFLSGNDPPGAHLRIMGHSHFVRDFSSLNVRYVNTGTWANVLLPPAGMAPGDVLGWLDRVRRGEVELRSPRSYVTIGRGEGTAEVRVHFQPVDR